MRKETINHFHICCGLGGGAKGFNQGQARVGQTEAEFRCIGGVDSDPAAIADFNVLAKAKGTVLDLFDRQQYIDWHGHEPPEGWQEATPDDMRRAAGGERPNIVFTSPPCKGYSALLKKNQSETKKYQALNRLAERGIYLTLEAWKDDPPEMLLMENVPQIASRGRVFLDRITKLLEHYGYAVSESTHDCGELGGLAESRRRFLLVARHQEKVPPFLYEPQHKPMKTVGDILSAMPLPGSEIAGAMHRVPNLQWKTWARLAFVEAGKDWRSLMDLNIDNGFLKDFEIIPDTEYQKTVYGVRKWDESTGTVTGRSTATNGAFSVADPRMAGNNNYGQYGVLEWNGQASTITSQRSPGQGRFSVPDPRIHNEHHGGRFHIVNKATAMSAAGDRSTLPKVTDKGVFIIEARDGTWHRPFTTLELAAIQSLVDPEEFLHLHGKSDGAWRERIGNAVPPDAAEAIASVMGQTILLARSGETFVLNALPIWVQPFAVATSVDTHTQSEMLRNLN